MTPKSAGGIPDCKVGKGQLSGIMKALAQTNSTKGCVVARRNRLNLNIRADAGGVRYLRTLSSPPGMELPQDISRGPAQRPRGSPYFRNNRRGYDTRSILKSPRLGYRGDSQDRMPHLNSAHELSGAVSCHRRGRDPWIQHRIQPCASQRNILRQQPISKPNIGKSMPFVPPHGKTAIRIGRIRVTRIEAYQG